MVKNKVRINITLDKSVYKNLKQRKIKASTFINQMLKAAIFSDSAHNRNNRCAAFNEPVGALFYFSNFFRLKLNSLKFCK